MGRRPPITNRVRELRDQNGGMTQAQLGKAVGVTRQTIIAIEQNRYSPSLETAFLIARLFDVCLDDVFQWNDEAQA
ncbi:MAG: helix-turn-helix transcriptional regulator [Pseudomonadota bacterium]